MLKAYARLITGHPRLVVAAIVLVTALAVTRVVDPQTGEPRLTLDPSVNSLLPSEDEGRTYYDRIRRIFGSDEMLLLAIHHPDGVFSPEILGALARITARLEDLDSVHHVVSLANAPNIRGSDGDLEVAPLYEEPPRNAAEAARVQREALENPLFADRLVSSDGRTTALLIYLLEIPEDVFTREEIDLGMRRIAEAELAGAATVWLTGGAHIKSETARFLFRDLSIIVPLAFLVVALVAFVSFRSAAGVLVPVSTTGIGLVWTLAVIADVGGSLNLVTVSVPILVLIIGFAYAVHVVSAFYDAAQGAVGDLTERMQDALARVALPTLLTGVTTAAGFLSLAASPLGAIKQFGVYSTLGVAASMLASLTWTPAVLALALRPQARRSEGGRMQGMLHALAAFDVRRRRGILWAGGAVALMAIFGLLRIDVSNDLVSNFKPDTEVRRSYEAVNESLGGAAQLYLILETDYRNAWKEPVNLETMLELQSWIESQPGAGKTTSLADYVRLIHRGFRDNDPSYHTIPDNARLVSQLLLFGGSDDLDRYVDSQYQIAAVRVGAKAMDSGALAELIRSIEERAAGLPDHIHARVTGNNALVAKTIDDIAFGQSVSLLTAFVIIYGILSLLFMSFRIGFLALVPNALPVLVYFGVLGWGAIALNTTTGLVACLVLGIAVDDTIHFFARFNTVAKQRASESEGVRDALLHVGRPVTYTSIALSLGFMLLALSSLKSQAEFGMLAAFTMFFAWLVDMTFTPALASRLRVVTLFDALALDLGDDPGNALPLFRGLSKTQARVAALMTEIDSFPKGHSLMRQGEKGDGLYLVIDGTLRSWTQQEGQRIELNVHERGDILGEVGLLHGERSANVDCETDARLLRIDRTGLERLEQRYPRIAARILSNLSEVLATRMQRLTDRLR